MNEPPTPAQRRAMLETFANPHPGRDYRIEHVQPEYTSVCPVTGQPDFGQIVVRYVADELCVELKSLKFYFQSYRNEGVFYEDLVNRVLDDLVAALAPRWMQVEGRFTPRGGMHSTIVAEHGQAGRP
jgi:7-cyano-7-deazaguanine reductase